MTSETQSEENLSHSLRSPQDTGRSPERRDSTPPMPVRRLHNFAYCPRLFYYQWVEDLFVENRDTAAGSALHKNVDRPSHWKEDLDLSERSKVRSLQVESERYGLTGVIDLIEDDGEGLKLIDYKKGSAARDEHGERCAKPYDRIQIGAYALLLKKVENVELASAGIYYAADRRQVAVQLDDSLIDETLTMLEVARAVAESGNCPPPLIDDPRCSHCSAYPICLPNESRFWSGDAVEGKEDLRAPRPDHDDGEILVVQKAGARVSKRAGEIQVSFKNEVVSRHPSQQIQSIYLFGPVQVTTQAVQACLEDDIPIAYFSPAGRYLGRTTGLPVSGVDARIGQYDRFRNEADRLELVREIIRSKIHNQRVLLMRNGDADEGTLKKMARLRDKAAEAASIDTARGFEGAAAAHYFRNFSTMIKSTGVNGFDFETRNRRPPRDPVNALLSQGYSILAKELTGVCDAVGLDPFFGFFHQPRFGRPALALDLMEEFRPLIVDSTVISLINRGELNQEDFVSTSRGVFLRDSGRRQFWQAWFRRLDSEVKHPTFGYRMSYRRMLEVQTRQLWRFVRGEAEHYHGFTTR